MNFTPLAAVQMAHMQDQCNIGRHVSSGTSSLGDPVDFWPYTTGTVCGLEMTGGTEQYKGQIFSTPVDAILRLPKGTEISVEDKILMVSGTASGDTFEVIGEPRKGPTGIRINLRRITV
jgi:hypothetical protein